VPKWVFFGKTMIAGAVAAPILPCDKKQQFFKIVLGRSRCHFVNFHHDLQSRSPLQQRNWCRLGVPGSFCRSAALNAPLLQKEPGTL